MHLNVHAYTNIVGVCVRTCFRLASLLRCILLQKCGLLLLVCVTTAATATATNAAAYNVVTAIVLLQAQGVLDSSTALHHATFAGHCGAAAVMLEAVWSSCVAQRHTDTKHLPRAQVNTSLHCSAIKHIASALLHCCV
jgi:hypothetical protein